MTPHLSNTLPPHDARDIGWKSTPHSRVAHYYRTRSHMTIVMAHCGLVAYKVDLVDDKHVVYCPHCQGVESMRNIIHE